MGDQPDARPLHTHRTTQHRKTRTHVHASTGIRNHDLSVRAAEDSKCLRLLGHWDRLDDDVMMIIIIMISMVKYYRYYVFIYERAIFSMPQKITTRHSTVNIF
jgi:hypothetical protein